MPAKVSEGKSRMMPPLPPAPPPDDSAPPPLPPGALTEEQGRCANCLTPLAGPFCWRCGQHVADYHRSVWRFVVDFFDSAFSWDNKFFRTIGPLLRRPGWLTQEFMAGRRVRYVHPLRLFLFTSFVCLALLQYAHKGDVQIRIGNGKNLKRHAAVQIDTDDDDDKQAVAEGSTPAASPAASPAPTTFPAAESPAASPAKDSLGSILRDTLRDAQAGHPAPIVLDEKLDAFGERLQKKIDAAGGLREFNERMTTNVQSKLSWVALAMLPIFALIMRVFFGRKGGYYFTYLVFSLHYHTFLLMFWVGYAWLNGLAIYLHSSLLHTLSALMLLVPLWYLFRALRQMYGQGWTLTAGKVFAIGMVHLLTLAAGLAMIGATAFL